MFLLSAYFLAVHSYKRMRLTTSVYGILISKLSPDAVSRHQCFKRFLVFLRATNSRIFSTSNGRDFQYETTASSNVLDMPPVMSMSSNFGTIYFWYLLHFLCVHYYCLCPIAKRIVNRMHIMCCKGVVSILYTYVCLTETSFITNASFPANCLTPVILVSITTGNSQ